MTYDELLLIIDKGTRDEVTRLDLRDNQLASLPPEIGQLTNLTQLFLCSNPLTSLPLEIAQLTNLSQLDLSDSLLKSLMPEIGHLTSLTQLYLRSTPLTSLPPEIVQLTNLMQLDLSDTLLTNLPPEIVQLTNLTQLDLSDTALTNLPPEIGQLTNLVRLDLRSNPLKSLPPEIGQLTNLKQLYLSDNLLKSLPPEIGQLTKLAQLDISDTPLTNLPMEIGQLTNLTQLYLSSNQLINLPPEIGQLTNLMRLDLSSNKLASLPPEIGQLTNLMRLDLSSNKLASLPPEIRRLNKLMQLDLRFNQLPIPPEILGPSAQWPSSGSPTKIINYYRNLTEEHDKPLNEAKMLLVGQSKVGKTSLVKRLLTNEFDLHESKTEGIDIQPWTISINSQDIQLNIWDFGGQEIMHATHQFFLTKRSLYLLVLDARLGEDENRIEYWLKIIQSFGDNSPIIVVGNQTDEHPLDIDQRGLKTKYPNIVAILETSCKKGEGLTELKTQIIETVRQLDHVFDLLPLTWFQIKQKLEQKKSDYIPYTEYENLCQSESLTDDLSQRTLIGLLHNLGVILNFQDDPRLEDTHVLNPEWVTNGVYRILNDRDLIMEQKGILKRPMLNRILDAICYPKKKHLFIIDMMRKFELCFPLEGFADEQFLIPDLLPKEESYTGDWEDSLAFEYHYNVLPNSIISRFIVRMNQTIHQKTYWRTGVVLALDGNTALVKSDREEKKMLIRVSGSPATRRSLLTAIRSQFDAIHSSIKGIQASAHVAIPNHPEIVVDYQHLLTLEQLGESTFIPQGLAERFSVKQLLDGIEQVHERQREGRGQVPFGDDPIPLPHPKPTPEVFISYAWGGDGEDLVNRLDEAFQQKGIPIIRDKRDLGFKGRIKAFMDQLGQGKAIIVVISKKYLESENCMYELLQIANHRQFDQRIFPIVLGDAKIYKPLDRIKYVKYWESQLQELDDAMKEVSQANLEGFRDDIDLYSNIRRNLPELTNILKDINTLTVEIHSESGFEQLISAVESKLADG